MAGVVRYMEFRSAMSALQLYSRKINRIRKCTMYSTQAGAIVVESIGQVTTISINNADNRNFLDETSYGLLSNEILKFENDKSSRAAAIFGVGGNFCAGTYSDLVLDATKLFTQCKKPIVAGITGYAVDFGFELALLCDLRVMEKTAQIGMNGNPGKMSDTFYKRLVRTVGLSNALDLALTGKNLGAREAHECGLINRVVECGAGVGQGIMLAKCISKFPKDTLSAIKSSIYFVAQ